MPSRPPQSLKARALQWLAQREHSRLELRRKLVRAARAARAAAPSGDGRDDAGEGSGALAEEPADLQAEVEALLDWLEAHHYASDTRFVESRVNARAARYGNQRIRQELGQHGTALDADTAARLKDSELARARAVWARKFGAEPAPEAVARARQMRFLSGRGFSADVIRRVLRGGHDDD